MFKETVKSCEHYRLVLGRHRGIRAVKAPNDANSLELLALQIEVFLRIPAALEAHIDGLHLQFFAAQFLINLDLDRKPVAVPTRDVGGIEPGHILGLDDEVFQALIQRMPQVDRPVCIGQAVVQNILRNTLSGLPDAVIEPHLLPAGERFRLVLGKVGLHGKAGFGQVERRFQVHRHSNKSPNC